MRRTPSKRLIIGALVVVLGLVVLVSLEEIGRKTLSRFVLPTRDAQWIWIAEPLSQPRPVAFYAVKEFVLPRKPLTARLLASADEEAVVFLNGEPIGGVRDLRESSLRAYAVNGLVHRGRNRLVVELRSARGVGGLMLRLTVDDAEGTREVVTDETWRVYRRPFKGIIKADVPLPEGEAPRVWGSPPTGRWALDRRARETPTIEQLGTARQAVAARSFRLESDHLWQALGRVDRFSPRLGAWITFDWGREVVAFIALRLPPSRSIDRGPIGLLFTGLEPPAVRYTTPDAYMIAMPGQRLWMDSTPRRFRYVTFVGLCSLSGAEAYFVDADRAENLLAGERQRGGAFGLRPTELGAPLENEVWSEFHRLASVAGREGRQ